MAIAIDRSATDFGLDLPDGRWADTRRGPIFFREWTGSGPHTFVLVHGLAGAHINWWRVAPALAAHGRVLALDLPGFGLTPRAGRSSGLHDLRLTLDAFLDATEAAPAILVGNSMGGSLALLQRALRPGSVEGLVLSSPAIPWGRGIRQPLISRVGFALYRLPGIGRAFAHLRMKGGSPAHITDLGFALLYGDRSSVDPLTRNAQTQLTARIMAEPDAVPAFLEAARTLLGMKSRARTTRDILERASCPVLLIHGDRDLLVPFAAAESVARSYPRWTFSPQRGLGHAIQMEAPDRWLTAVNDWLTGAF